MSCNLIDQNVYDEMPHALEISALETFVIIALYKSTFTIPYHACMIVPTIVFHNHTYIVFSGILLRIFSMFGHGFLVYSFLVESQWETLAGNWLW